MADVTPTGFLSGWIARLRELVAASATFQAWVDVSSKEAAVARIHLAPVVEPALPFAGVNYAEKDGWRLRKVGEPSAYATSGMLDLYFCADVPAEYRAVGEESNAFLWFTNKLGAILDDMGDLQGTGTGFASGLYFDLQQADLLWMERTAPESRKMADGSDRDHMDALFQVPFGVSGQ